jgi:hypothetical protein
VDDIQAPRYEGPGGLASGHHQFQPTTERTADNLCTSLVASCTGLCAASAQCPETCSCACKTTWLTLYYNLSPYNVHLVLLVDSTEPHWTGPSCGNRSVSYFAVVCHVRTVWPLLHYACSMDDNDVVYSPMGAQCSCWRCQVTVPLPRLQPSSHTRQHCGNHTSAALHANAELPAGLALQLNSCSLHTRGTSHSHTWSTNPRAAMLVHSLALATEGAVNMCPGQASARISGTYNGIVNLRHIVDPLPT